MVGYFGIDGKAFKCFEWFKVGSGFEQFKVSTLLFQSLWCGWSSSCGVHWLRHVERLYCAESGRSKTKECDPFRNLHAWNSALERRSHAGLGCCSFLSCRLSQELCSSAAYCVLLHSETEVHLFACRYIHMYIRTYVRMYVCMYVGVQPLSTFKATMHPDRLSEVHFNPKVYFFVFCGSW